MSNGSGSPKKFVQETLQGLTGSNSLLVEQWYSDGESLLERLVDATRKSTDAAELKLATDAWTELSVLLKHLVNLDTDVHFPGFVELACTSWWDSVTQRQLDLSLPMKDSYRAMAAYVMAQLAFRQRDRGATLRWATLGYLADKLGGHTGRGGNEVTLRFGLSVPKTTIDMLDSLVAAANETANVEHLPEWLLVDALDDAGGAVLVAPSPLYSHHPSTPFAQACWSHACKDVSGNAKGTRLEQLVGFLVSTVPGMRPRRRLKADGDAAEHDVVGVVCGESSYALPERAPEWLIECKNWKHAVGVETLGCFLAKMVRADAKFGLVIAKSGVTKADGKLSLAYAERFRSEFCLREGVVCLVIDETDRSGLGSQGTFRGLVDSRYERWRFGS